MSLFERFGDPATYRGGIVSIGNFDGVHRGHQAMIDALVGAARRKDVPAVVMTFDPHPLALIRPEHVPPQLCTLQRKTELLTSRGVDVILPYPTDWELLKLTPEEFFETIVGEKLQAQGLVEGPNFCFGRHREGDIDTLRELCEASGKSLQVILPVEHQGQLVSSSRIRKLLTDGDFVAAKSLLGHAYRLSGRVGQGEQRGRLLGFPTANLVEIETLIPADGVYAGEATFANENRYVAAVHIGPNPTFRQADRKVEVHLLDFSGDVYGEMLHVDLHDRLRGTQKFGSVDDLRDQLHRDVEHVRRIVKNA